MNNEDVVFCLMSHFGYLSGKRVGVEAREVGEGESSQLKRNTVSVEM